MNYHEMTAYELEQKYDSLAEELMASTSDERIQEIADELDLIQDELDSRDQMEEE